MVVFFVDVNFIFVLFVSVVDVYVVDFVIVRFKRIFLCKGFVVFVICVRFYICKNKNGEIRL